MKWVAVAAIALGCGRIGFDPLGNAPGSGDAPRAGSDAGTGSGGSGSCATCMAAGGTCSGNTCVFGVTTTGPLTCPPGLTCEFDCNVASACSSIDCSMAAGCTIECNSPGTCSNGTLRCDTSGCTEYCRATNTCDGGTYTGAGNGAGVVQCCGLTSCSNTTGNETLFIPGTCP